MLGLRRLGSTLRVPVRRHKLDHFDARRPSLLPAPPRSESVWNSDNFRADIFAKAVKRAAAKVKPARRADFGRLEFHDLRHTFGSLMIAAGESPPARRGAGAHRRERATLPHARMEALRPPLPGSTREEAAAAAAAFDRHLKAIAS